MESGSAIVREMGRDLRLLRENPSDLNSFRTTSGNVGIKKRRLLADDRVHSTLSSKRESLPRNRPRAMVGISREMEDFRARILEDRDR